MKATWHGAVLAQSERCIEVEGNQYFPSDSLDRRYFQKSDERSFCDWKGGWASYYDIVVDGAINKGAAWYYPATGPRAKDIQGYVAFWRGVQVSDEP